MNIRSIKALASLLEQHGLTAIEVCEGEEKVRLERAPAAVGGQMASYPYPAAALTTPSVLPVEEETVDFNHLIEVKSPMVGVFYSAASPDAEPLVHVGDRVKKGDVLCIIEAMKLMNELTAEIDGEVVDICVENGQLVEYGQCLFKLA